jgi:hypothetical protein
LGDKAHDGFSTCALWRAIVAYAGGRADVADEAVAEAFARAIERDGQVRDPKVYLYRVAFRVAASELRQRTEAPIEEAVVEDVLPLGDLGPALRQLSPAQRAAIFLHYEADQPVREVAVRELTSGLGAHSVIEAVGTQESMMQAIRSTRPGGPVGYVGVAHDVELAGEEMFHSHIHLHGGPASVRRFLPQLVDLIWNREIDPGKVFDLTLPLDQVAKGYRAMDERRAIKALL